MAPVQDALGPLVDRLSQSQGWTMERLAEAAQMSQEALGQVMAAPAKLTSGDTRLKAIAKVLHVDAWLLERAASSPRENVDELVRVADRMTGGSIGRIRQIVGDSVPNDLEDAIRVARATLTPARQLELAHLISVYVRLPSEDREYLLGLAARLLDGRPAAGSRAEPDSRTAEPSGAQAD